MEHGAWDMEHGAWDMEHGVWIECHQIPHFSARGCALSEAMPQALRDALRVRAVEAPAFKHWG